MATVTNSRRRGERSSGSNKVAASKPKLRQTSVANRGVQSGTPKPGTYTSNNTMAPKKPSPTNQRGAAQRKTGGKAGGRAGKPSGPVAGTKDKTVRVPASWKAQTVDPTNQRGGNQRPTGGQAGGRAGRPAGNIARPKPKAPAAKPPAAKPTATKPPVKGTPQAEKWLKDQLKGKGKPSLKLATLRQVLSKGNIGSLVVGGLAEKALGPLAQKAGTALGKGPLTRLGRAIDDLRPGINSKDESRRKSSRTGPTDSRTSKLANTMPSRPVGTKATLNGKPVYWDGYKWSKSSGSSPAKPAVKPADKPKPAATTPARSTAPSRSSAPGRSTTSARTPAASRPAAKPAAKPATSANKTNYPSMYSSVKNFSGGGSSTDPTKSYGTRVNSSFSAKSPSSMTKRQSLKDQTADIKKMIEASKKRQGKG